MNTSQISEKLTFLWYSSAQLLLMTSIRSCSKPHKHALGTMSFYTGSNERHHIASNYILQHLLPRYAE